MARPSTWALGALAVGLLGLAGSLLEAVLADQNRALGLLQTQTLTRQLGLTDPALMTEARYGRHLSQADRHTPFQDHPLAFDHFPTGSMLPPPRP
ncbi:hypothetical protein [Brachymonas denitrificans]|uniref:hypothetical protein n=1 Tax=Brachymonas denitrificans TaxID=28220 RepID=UPI001BCC96A7|nr:hypothetical protein [Brachymonas denitrificans]